MKIKILTVGLIFLFLAFCASVPKEEKVIRGSDPPRGGNVILEGSFSFGNKSFEEVWERCLKTIVDLNFGQYGSNRSKGQILILRVVRTTVDGLGPGLIKEEDRDQMKVIRDKKVEYIYLYIKISENNEGAVLSCMVTGHESLAGRGKTELNRFIDALNRNLNK